MICEMCGSPGKLFKTIIEGAELNVCQECSKFGKVISVVKQGKIEAKNDRLMRAKEPEKELMDIIVEDYAEKIRGKRESLGLKQEEFAKKINEKESLIQKIESGHYEPSIGLAKKIERFLKIKLVEEHEERHEKQKSSKIDIFTIGDFIKIRKK